ncbi:MAG TPA: FkbM family methyltransferase [Candidatus Paceibacterota bacterium]|nr:FkbM family methyltransferase [Candidatus Paceibacterota bacterium]
MSVNPLRKILWKAGLDFHKYRPKPNQLIWLKERGIKTVLDIGANTGQFAEEIRSVLPDAFIYSFEPLKDCYDELVASRAGDPRFQAFNCALGDRNAATDINRSSYSASSSLLKMAQLHKDLYPHTKGESTEAISVRRLDDIPEMRSARTEKNILVKMDTQGYEDKVILGGAEFLKSANALIVETSFVPFYEGQALFADIYKLLTSLGFTYKGGIDQRHDGKDGGILREDSLFVR